jgi:hypothetical protein
MLQLLPDVLAERANGHAVGLTPLRHSCFEKHETPPMPYFIKRGQGRIDSGLSRLIQNR